MSIISALDTEINIASVFIAFTYSREIISLVSVTFGRLTEMTSASETNFLRFVKTTPFSIRFECFSGCFVQHKIFNPKKEAYSII